MQHRIQRALLGATLALVLTPAAAAAATTVTVRVEGASRTLLAPTKVSVPSSGSITKGGAPAGSCPAHSAAGQRSLAGARVTGTGLKQAVRSNAKGVAVVKPTAGGTLVLRAQHSASKRGRSQIGYVRAAPSDVRITA